MATRYYTEEAYEQIRQTIEQIDSADVNQVMDFFGDLFQRLAQYLKFYSVDDYQNDMQTWYNKVLNSHDSTLSEVSRIFGAVESVDFEYRDIMEEALGSITNFRSTLNCLRDVISGKTGLSDGKAAADTYLAAGKNSLNSAYDTILTKMEQGALWDASKALFGDAIKYGAGYLKCRDGNVADYKNFADTWMATACDLLTMAAIVLPPLAAFGDSLDGHMDMSYEDYLDARFMLLSPAQQLKDTNSISDLLENLSEDMDEQLEGCPEDSPMYPAKKRLADDAQFVSDTYEKLEAAIDLYGIGKDLKDFHDDIDGWVNGKTYTEKEYAKLFDTLKDNKILDLYKDGSDWIYKVKVSPGEIIKKVVSDGTGIPFSGWTYPSKTDGNVFKLMGTLWSYGEKLLPDTVDGYSNVDDIPDVVFDKFKGTKFLKDVFDFARDLDDLVTSDSSATPTGSPQCGESGGNWFQCEMGVN